MITLAMAIAARPLPPRKNALSWRYIYCGNSLSWECIIVRRHLSWDFIVMGTHHSLFGGGASWYGVYVRSSKGKSGAGGGGRNAPVLVLRQSAWGFFPVGVFSDWGSSVGLSGYSSTSRSIC